MAVVDIIIPLYNKEATIARAIDSICGQTFQDWRLIVVNDGSTDAGGQVVTRYSDPRICYIEQENRGPGAARNRGIAEAAAEYLAFLDADDEWYPSHLESALKEFNRSEIAFVGSMYEDYPDRIDMAGYWRKNGVVPGTCYIDPNTPPQQALSRIFFFHVGNTLVRTAVVKKYKGFYDRDKCLLGEDTVFFAKLVLNEKFSIIEAVTVRHNRQHSELSNLPDRPLDIFLRMPQIILDDCLPAKREYARKVLVWHAWNTAHFRARAGRKADAVYLKDNYPEMKKLGVRYLRLCFEITLSRWFPGWIKFKLAVRSWIKPAG